MSRQTTERVHLVFAFHNSRHAQTKYAHHGSFTFDSHDIRLAWLVFMGPVVALFHGSVPLHSRREHSHQECSRASKCSR